MRVSIISPLYNSAPYLVECIDSLLAQTMQDFEVLFVDDHGQDNSFAVARAYVEEKGENRRFRFLQTPENSGPGIARNIGIEAATGDYVAFIDSDDRWEPTYLEQLLGAAAGEMDLAYCQLRYEGGGRDGKIHRNPVISSGTFTADKKQYFLLRFVTFSVCFLFRRSFLMENGLRFPGERNSEDTHFLTRCLLLSQTIACVDVPLYIYCIRSQSLTTGHNPNRWKARLSALNNLMAEYRRLKRDPRYSALHLERYTFTMYLIWLKKGLAQAVKEFWK